MDRRKLAVLRSIGYTFPATCGLCMFMRRGTKDPTWGTCMVHEYQHEKHSGDARELSVHASGSCGEFQPREDASDMLGGYAEFLP